MKKTVLTFGLISSAILCTMIVVSTGMMKKGGSMAGSEVFGYLSMLIAFAFMFVAVKSYRDRYLGGVISFGKAFQVGLYVALITSFFYVVTWAIIYKFVYPEFMTDYTAQVLSKAQASGASATELAKKSAEMESIRKAYDTWLGFIGFALMEILPLGVIVALIAAAVLKRKTPKRALVLEGVS